MLPHAALTALGVISFVGCSCQRLLTLAYLRKDAAKTNPRPRRPNGTRWESTRHGEEATNDIYECFGGHVVTLAAQASRELDGFPCSAFLNINHALRWN